MTPLIAALTLTLLAAVPAAAERPELKEQALDAGRPLRERLAAIAALSRLDSPCPSACVRAAADSLLEVAREAAWRSKSRDWARDIVVEEAAAAAARLMAEDPEFEAETLVAAAMEDAELPDEVKERALERARAERRR